MIVRILGEGQFEISEDHAAAIESLDRDLESALSAADDAAFAAALQALVEDVRKAGSRLPDDSLVPSDLAIPPAGASRAEVLALLNDEKAIPD